jgi:hypothetical protein
MGTGYDIEIGPRLWLRACAHGRRGVPTVSAPNAVAVLSVTPDGSPWCVVMVGGDECLPTGANQLALSLSEAERLIKALQRAVDDRRDALKFEKD